MPRKASARKAGTRKTTRNADRAQPPTGPEIDRMAAKNANPAHRQPSEETARLNAASQTGGQRAPQPTEEELRKTQAAQGPSGHPLGTAKAPKPNLNKAVAKVQGQTKILREKGTPPKAAPQHVVQQGGGGTVSASGDAIR